MSRRDKLLKRLKGRPKDFTWNELGRLLRMLGYSQVKRGKSSGSRRRFVHPSLPTISLHQPHPGNTLKAYQVDQLVEALRKEGLL